MSPLLRKNGVFRLYPNSGFVVFLVLISPYSPDFANQTSQIVLNCPLRPYIPYSPNSPNGQICGRKYFISKSHVVRIFRPERHQIRDQCKTGNLRVEDTETTSLNTQNEYHVMWSDFNLKISYVVKAFSNQGFDLCRIVTLNQKLCKAFWKYFLSQNPFAWRCVNH